MSELPTFEDMRRRAYAALGDVQDELRSDWRPGTGPTPEQREAAGRAKILIAQAKEALNRAASGYGPTRVDPEDEWLDEAFAASGLTFAQREHLSRLHDDAMTAAEDGERQGDGALADDADQAFRTALYAPEIPPGSGGRASKSGE